VLHEEGDVISTAQWPGVERVLEIGQGARSLSNEIGHSSLLVRR
jgi:hypothetical protein